MDDVLFSPTAKAALVFGWFAVPFALERLAPAAPAPEAARPLWRRWGRNGGLWLANSGCRSPSCCR